MTTGPQSKDVTMPSEDAVASNTGPSGPAPRPRDKAPERAYRTEVGGQAAITRTEGDAAAPVNIRVKDAPGDVAGGPDGRARPDSGVTEAQKEATSGAARGGTTRTSGG